jgi:class 3 adenylate cyclase
VERAARTSAILVSDMVGSTRLRARLGPVDAERLRKHHDELLAAAVADHDGDVLRWTGDGLKAAFATPAKALDAAVAIQRAVTGYGTGAGAVMPFQVRIGLAAGEVTVDDGDHHGLPAIEAARLEALARPGEILATQSFAQVVPSPPVSLVPAGAPLLKGLDQPTPVVRVEDARNPTPREPESLTTARRWPMVGRDQATAAFSAAWAEARFGQPGAIVVSAVAGHGKSTFLAAMGRSALADGAFVLAGACNGDIEVPY